MVLAMMRGLVGEVLSLVSWVMSLIAAKMAAQPLAETVFSFIRPSALGAVAGFIAAFAAALLLLFFLRSLLTGAIKAIGLGGVNRFLGAVFGLLRGFAVVTLAVLVCAFTDLPKSDEWQNAYSSPFSKERLLWPCRTCRNIWRKKSAIRRFNCWGRIQCVVFSALWHTNR